MSYWSNGSKIVNQHKAPANQDGLKDIKNELHRVLSEASEGSTTFAIGSSLSKTASPGLFIHNHGMIGLPLGDHDAKAITTLTKQSPFGHREQTLIDTSVRRSWELDPSQFQLRNPEWSKQVDLLLDAVYAGLRLICGRENIGAELYKLLLYEEGAFFKPHKDSEKVPGMFGTLVICLPSLHEGGMLQLKHDGKTLNFNFSGSSQFDVSFAAWYADITHEVMPVTSGRRLVLTYNMVRNAANTSIPSPRSNQERQSRIRAILETYDAKFRQHSNDWPSFLLHTLTHKYTQASLSFDSLKGEDHETVQCLMEVCADNGFELYLAILERERVVDEENDEEIEDNTRLKDMINLSGHKIKGSMSLPSPDGCLLVSQKGLKRVADESEHEGWTGNEGATARYWYRNASVLIVPKFGKIKTMYDIEDKITSLGRMRKLEPEAVTNNDSREQLLQMCKLVLSESPYESVNYYFDEQSRKPNEIFTAALTIALEYDKLDIFDCGATEGRFSILKDYAQALGRTTAHVGLDQMKSRLLNIAREAPDANEKFKFLDSMYKAFAKLSSHQPDLVKQCRTWCDTQMIQKFSTSVLRRKDGIALAKLCLDLDEASIDNKVWPIVMKSRIATRIAFLNAYSAKKPPIVPKNDMKLRRSLIEAIWNDFKFPGYVLLPRSESASTYVSIYHRQPPAPKADAPHMLQPSDISQLLSNDIALSKDEGNNLDTNNSTRRIVDAVRSAPPEAIANTVVPFVKVLVLENSQRRPNDIPMSSKTIVHHALYQYVKKYVGEEPRPPSTWTMSPRSCNCNDCVVVNSFLVDPRKQVLKFPCGSGRRAHLHRTFGDRSGSWSIETLHVGNPHAWQMTKTRTQYDTAHAAWKTRFEQANTTFTDMAGDKILKKFLGDECSAIMSAQTALLRREPGQPFAEVHQNQSTINRTSDSVSSTLNPGMKRSLDSIDEANILKKRIRSDDGNGQQRSLDGQENMNLAKSTVTDERGQEIEIIEID